MSTTLSDEELASKLEETQVDRVYLDEAARRIRQSDLQRLLYTNDIVETIHKSPLLDEKTSELAEKLITGVPAYRRSSSRLSSMAAKILRGGSYTAEDVRSLAASVLSQDETLGQT